MRLLLLSLLVAAPCGAEESLPSKADDEAAIRELVRQTDVEMTSGDLEGLVALYTEDAVEMGQNRPVIHGKDAIRDLEKRFLDANDAEVRSTVEDIQVSGDLAVVRARFTVSSTRKNGGNTTTIVAKSLRVCHRQADGSWKIGTLIWNMDGPPSSN